ncbi:MAG TPA: hypothetical protein PLG49_04665 [Defluviitaleaceae bacterium]|nr:hypothetical protein [Defluviitaleaceae bacterium]
MAIIVAGKGIHWLNPTLIKQIKKPALFAALNSRLFLLASHSLRHSQYFNTDNSKSKFFKIKAIKHSIKI